MTLFVACGFNALLVVPGAAPKYRCRPQTAYDVASETQLPPRILFLPEVNITGSLQSAAVLGANCNCQFIDNTKNTAFVLIALSFSTWPRPFALTLDTQYIPGENELLSIRTLRLGEWHICGPDIISPCLVSPSPGA